ncbi:MAG: PepSY-associated TM helix domain-containing protein [bacterium]|nr:PepSY-associated TM helix domain-containing protein [bacterium]
MSSGVKKRKSRWLYSRSAALTRWLHLYLSLISFATLMFFSFTGLTLNHPAWFGASEPVIRDEIGQLAVTLIEGSPDKLAIAEELRAKHRLRGKVAEFEIDEYEMMIVFKSPGYAADAFVDRETGEYSVTESATGVIAILNDLHKGRDSGGGWSWVIDVSAVATLLVSVTGLALLVFIRKHRVAGFAVVSFGAILLLLAWAVLVP